MTLPGELLVFATIGLLLAIAVGLSPSRNRRNSSDDWWIWYRSYLRSPEWEVKRQSVISRAGGRCEKCGNYGRRIDAHHLPGSYSRIPHELPWDLAALCYECHKGEHRGKRF